MTLLGELLQLLPRVVPFDTGFLATTDPSTLLFTGGVAVEPTHAHDGSVPRFLANEFLDDDVMKFRDVASSSQRVEWLQRATNGRPETSARYRELFATQGMGDELRAAFVTAGACWGVVCIAREKGAPTFQEREARAVAQLAPHVAEGLRAALVFGPATRAAPDPGGPAVLLLAPDLSITAATPAAARWLADLAESGGRGSPDLPVAVTSVVSLLRECTGPAETEDVQPRVCAPTRSGRWVVIHGSHLTGDRDRSVAITIEPARPGELAPLLMHGHGLTPKESEVTRLILLGHPTRHISDRLRISDHTVQDHLKSIFTKVGVSSRRELISRVLSQHEPVV